MNVTAYDLAQRFVGIKEVAGVASNLQILAMLRLDGDWPANDEVPWCSAFVNYVAWLLRLPRSKSLTARSWLAVGVPVPMNDAEPGFDVVVMSRGTGQPGATNLDAPGHVGFFAGYDGNYVVVLGGNQGDSVSVALFAQSRILGIRRLWEE